MMVVKRIFIIFFLSINFCTAQTFKKNSAFAEVSGHSRSLYSLNYERFIGCVSKNIIMYGRTGIGFTPAINLYDTVHAKPGFAIPLTLSLIAGKRVHFAQFGLSYTACFGETFTETIGSGPIIYQNFESAFIVSFGYRFVDVSGVTVQLFPTYVWTTNPSKESGFLLGLCLGFSW